MHRVPRAFATLQPNARSSARAHDRLALARGRFVRSFAPGPRARADEPRPQADTHSPRPRVRPALSLAALALASLALAGCSTRHDLNYNRYAPPGGRPTLLQTADHLADLPGRALDNLDERIENAVY